MGDIRVGKLQTPFRKSTLILEPEKRLGRREAEKLLMVEEIWLTFLILIFTRLIQNSISK